MQSVQPRDYADFCELSVVLHACQEAEAVGLLLNLRQAYKKKKKNPHTEYRISVKTVNK